MEYEVEKIVAHREHEGQMQYFIKWKGFSSEENTWEPAGNLVSCEKLLQNYNRRRSQTRRSTKSSRKEVEAVKVEQKQGHTDDGVVSSVEARDANFPEGDRPARTEDRSITEPGDKFVTRSYRTREERAEKREVGTNLTGGGRKRRANGKRKQLVIPFKLQERDVSPEIMDATQIEGELYFVVKWPDAEQLELIRSTEMYVEYPMNVFKFYEKCMGWVHFGSSESNC